MYKYFIKVVSTDVHYLNGSTLKTNQYASTFHEQEFPPNSQNLAGAAHMSMYMTLMLIRSWCASVGIFFNYDISPMIVTYRQSPRKPLSAFLTDLCAIVGGVLTIAAILDGLIWQAEHRLRHKMDIGKAS